MWTMNDWAIFQRVSGEFSYFPAIDVSLRLAPTQFVSSSSSTTMVSIPVSVLHHEALVLHCPVILYKHMKKVEEFRKSCNIQRCIVQTQSKNHIHYNRGDLCGGSSGGAVHMQGFADLVGLHTSSITEVDYEIEDENTIIAASPMRVSSEDTPYVDVNDTLQQNNKKQKCDSETVASLTSGNQGLGSALIICQYARLMHYINTFNKDD